MTVTWSRCVTRMADSGEGGATGPSYPQTVRGEPAMSRRRGGPFEVFARKATEWTGSSWAFGLAILTIVVWACSYPLFSNFDTWQLVINTGTTIVTFLMVFLIQRSQNKDSQALHLKLNELVAAVEGASNRLINIEDLSEEEVALLHRHYKRLLEL